MYTAHCNTAGIVAVIQRSDQHLWGTFQLGWCWNIFVFEALDACIPNLKEDLCASLQTTVIEILMKKLRQAAKDLKINTVAVAGGVSANSGLRDAFLDYGKRYRASVFIPPFSFTTDNAAMIAQAGYYRFLDGQTCPLSEVPYAKTKI